MKIDDNFILEEKDILLDCLISEQQLLQSYAQTISQTNVKNIVLELNSILTDEQAICCDLTNQIEKLGKKQNGSDKS